MSSASSLVIVEIEESTRYGIQLQLSSSQESRRELVQALVALKSRMAAGGGCEIFESLSRANAFLWTHWWPSTEKLEEHLQSQEWRLLLGAIEVLGNLEGIWIIERRALRNIESVVGVPPSTAQSSPAAPPGKGK